MKRERMVMLMVMIIAIVAMGASIVNGFVYDDLPAIVHNTRVTDPSRWHTIPMAPYWIGTLWRPVTVAGFALQWWAGHGSPLLFHALSLVAYAALCGLLYRLIRSFAVPAGPAATVAMIFAVHPVHTEVVANVVGQAELWVALALTGATLLYVRARNSGNEPRALAPILLLGIVAMAAKEQGFMLPLLLLGAEWLLVRPPRAGWAGRVRLLLPVTGLAVVLFMLRAAVLNDLKGEIPVRSLVGVGFGDRVLTLLGIIPAYARLLLVPLHLQGDYSPPGVQVGGPFTATHTAGIAFLFLVVGLFLWSRLRAPIAAFGIWWLAIMLAPVTNLVTVSGILMSERALFAPSIGFALLLVGIGAPWVERLAEERHTLQIRIIYTAARIAVIIGGIISFNRVQVWRSQESFYSSLAVDAPRAYLGWKVAAEHWVSAGDTARAITSFRKSLRLYDRDPDVYEWLGQTYRGQGNCEAAVPVLRQGLVVDSSVPSMRAKMVECLIALRQWQEAHAVARAGVALGLAQFKQEDDRVTKFEARDTSQSH